MTRNRNQIFSIPTYDAIFKWLLDEGRSIRPSFLHTFIPGLNIRSSERVDDHMNPIKELELLRDLFHSKKTDASVAFLNESEFGVHVLKNNKMVISEEATHFLSKILKQFDDLKIAFPKVKYDGTMDFVCELDTKELILVEMQIIPYDYWDQRALAYVAAVYGRQLRKGGKWDDIKRVIGINILGGGKDQTIHWKETPDQFVRHYKIVEQLHADARIMDGMEIIQYSIMNAPKNIDDQETRDWLTFFQSAHLMSEKEVRATIKTPAVLNAFQRIKYDQLPSEVRKEYENEDKEYDRISEYTKSIKAESKAEGKAEGKAEERLKAELEKAEMQERAEQEKTELQNKAEREKTELQNKAEREKTELQEKAEREKMELKEKAEREKKLIMKEMARNLHKQGISSSVIRLTTQLSTKEIESLICEKDLEGA